MIGNNSCGIHSVMAQFYGHGPLTVNQIESLDILTYDGERLTVGATSSEELSSIIAAGGRKGQIYADPQKAARRPRRRNSQTLPRYSAPRFGL